MKILIDNGHSLNTPGKRSPDKTFYEWEFNREIAIPLVEELRRRGFDAERIVPEDVEDISLSERCRRVNAWCSKLGAKNVLLVSIHANAAGSGGWNNATGWCVFVYRNASQASRKLAQTLYAEAEKRGFKGNRSVPKERYWTSGFYILRCSKCPAVLTENLFYDNKSDLAILQSEEGKRKIVELHVEGIINYLNSQRHE